MSRPFVRFTAVLVLAVAASAQGRGGPTVDAPRPRLVVLCSIDQLADWVWQAARPHFGKDGGFARLLGNGAYFPQCAYEHACSETGPGHATIGTGAPAAGHGIVRNAWWSPADGRAVYCVEEPMAALPELKEGKDRGPGRLLLPTLGDGVKAHVPGAKVVSVSWKDRAAILMAGRSADIVCWFEATTGNLVTNTAWVDKTPGWIVDFNEKRAIDGFHGWVWDRFGPPDAYAGLVDDRPYEVPHQNGSNQRTLPQPVTGGKPEPGGAFYTQVYVSPVGNTMVRLAGEAAVRGNGLGSDDVPDLLCISFSSVDIVGHTFGPDSVEARDTLLRLDRELATFFAFLDREVGADRWAVFVTADHGVGPTPEWAKAHGVDAGRGLLQTQARAAAEKALTEQFGAPPEGKRWITHVGEFSLFFDQAVLESKQGALDAATMHRQASRIAAAAAAGTKGFAAAFATSDLLETDPLGDPLRIALRKALCPGRAGDVQLVVKPYWLDGVIPASHGTPHPYDREVVAFAMGPGVPAGVRFAAPITPGFGTVLFAEMLGIPKPPGAVDTLPAGLFRMR
ncbi:MAG: alkaline phosphatase family protein [Planctomycetes bacterium]|nr:alkaline phosphatase family protein [Planctomycetota bacterium]